MGGELGWSGGVGGGSWGGVGGGGGTIPWDDDYRALRARLEVPSLGFGTLRTSGQGGACLLLVVCLDNLSVGWLVSWLDVCLVDIFLLGLAGMIGPLCCYDTTIVSR